MATIRECDRCGVQSTRGTGAEEVRMLFAEGDDNPPIHTDLCLDCWAALRNFLKPLLRSAP